MRGVDAEGLVRAHTIILYPEYLRHVCAALNSDLNNPAEHGSTGSLLRRAAEILDHTAECLSRWARGPGGASADHRSLCTESADDTNISHSV